MEPASVECDASANACDDAAAATWDKTEAVTFTDVDAAAVAAAVDRSRTLDKGIICKFGNGVDVPFGKTANGAFVGSAECGFATVKLLDNPLFRSLRNCGQCLPVSSANIE